MVTAAATAGDGRSAPRPTAHVLAGAGLFLWILAPGTGATATGGGTRFDTVPSPARLLGQVRLAGTLAPAPGVRILLPEVDRETVTDSSGSFALEGLPPGELALQIRYPDGEPTVDRVRLRAGGLTRVQVTVEPRVFVLRRLTVYVERDPGVDPLAGFHRRQRRGEGIFFDEEDVRRRDPERLSQLLRDVPGLRIGPAGFGRADVSSSRSASPCRPTFFIDGALAGYFPIDAIAPEGVVGIEIYRGASEVPPQFNPPVASGCGVVLVWTRSGRERRRPDA